MTDGFTFLVLLILSVVGRSQSAVSMQKCGNLTCNRSLGETCVASIMTKSLAYEIEHRSLGPSRVFHCQTNPNYTKSCHVCVQGESCLIQKREVGGAYNVTCLYKETNLDT